MAVAHAFLTADIHGNRHRTTRIAQTIVRRTEYARAYRFRSFIPIPLDGTDVTVTHLVRVCRKFTGYNWRHSVTNEWRENEKCSKKNKTGFGQQIHVENGPPFRIGNPINISSRSRAN